MQAVQRYPVGPIWAEIYRGEIEVKERSFRHAIEDFVDMARSRTQRRGVRAGVASILGHAFRIRLEAIEWLAMQKPSEISRMIENARAGFLSEKPAEPLTQEVARSMQISLRVLEEIQKEVGKTNPFDGLDVSNMEYDTLLMLRRQPGLPADALVLLDWLDASLSMETTLLLADLSTEYDLPKEELQSALRVYTNNYAIRAIYLGVWKLTKEDCMNPDWNALKVKVSALQLKMGKAARMPLSELKQSLSK